MAIIVTYDGTPITHDFDPAALNIGHRAEMGEETTGGIPLEDPDGTLAIVGHRPVTVEEDECAQPRLFTGWTATRNMGRKYDDALIVSDARIVDTTVVDINEAFSFRMITGSDGNRPQETWQARCTWILGSDYLDGLVDTSEDFIVTNTTLMDPADYRTGYPVAVMNDLSDRSGNAYTFFLFYRPSNGLITLFFDNPSSYISACTLSISNVLADVDYAAVFPPDNVAVLAREPDLTYSGVTVEYNDGTLKLYRRRPSTETTYIRRETTIQRPYTKGVATATAQAEAWLDKHAVETDRITCSIQVPAASVGLIQAGQSIDVKFSHLGFPYIAWTTMRIVSCSPKPTNDVGDFYDVALELVYRPPVAPPEGECGSQSIEWIADSAPTWVYPPKTDSCSGTPTFTPGVVVAATVLHNAFTHTNDYLGDLLTVNAPWTLIEQTGKDDDVYEQWIAGCAYLPWTTGAVDDVTVEWTGAYSPAPNGKGEGHVTFVAIRTDAVAPVQSGKDYGGPTVTLGAAPTEGNLLLLVYCAPESSMTPTGWTVLHRSTNGVQVFYRCVGAGESADVDVYISASDNHKWNLLSEWTVDTDPDVVTDLGPTPGATTLHDADPTVDDDADAGYTVGSHWINETSGHEFVLVDSTTGSAVWVSTTAVSVFSFSTTDGVTTVDPTTSLTFVGATLADLGGGDAEVTFADANAVTNIDGGKEVVNTVAAAGATETLDLGDGNVHDVTLTADCTLTFAGATAGVACSFTLLLRQDGTGGWTTTWPGSVVWAGGSAPTLDETASTLAVLTFVTVDGGTVWLGFPTGGGGGTPATTVTDETTWGITPAVGSDTEYARQDHTHGSPARPAGELLVADGTSGNGDNLSSYVEMTTPDTTTSASLEDLTGATTTITLQTTSHIAVWMSCHVSASGVCDYGIAINIDGVDHDEVVTHLTTVDEGNVIVLHRTATALAPGTYTVKGRHRRVSGGGTPETDRADLLVMAMGHEGPIMLVTDDGTDYLYED